ncbi:MAG: hypothetical protein EAZ43_13345 [Betaproteobacteria bacterium]|nr:MAG: hypothetical protein EAZ43_13345 [Betaproteobacteria bacterium]
MGENKDEKPMTNDAKVDGVDAAFRGVNTVCAAERFFSSFVIRHSSCAAIRSARSASCKTCLN